MNRMCQWHSWKGSRFFIRDLPFKSRPSIVLLCVICESRSRLGLKKSPLVRITEMKIFLSQNKSKESNRASYQSSENKQIKYSIPSIPLTFTPPSCPTPTPICTRVLAFQLVVRVCNESNYDSCLAECFRLSRNRFLT